MKNNFKCEQNIICVENAGVNFARHVEQEPIHYMCKQETCIIRFRPESFKRTVALHGLA